VCATLLRALGAEEHLVSSFGTTPFTEDGEIRVNQSGSVALSAEEVRGPPQRKWLIMVALLTQRKSYELGGRWYPYLGPPEATKPVILRG